MNTVNFKKALLFNSLFAFAALQSFSQQQKSLPARENYLLKSKHQKTTGYILLAAGLAASVTGFVIFKNDAENYLNPFSSTSGKGTRGSGIMIGGAVTIALSIPFFISSKKNRRRASSVSFKNADVSQSACNTARVQ